MDAYRRAGGRAEHAPGCDGWPVVLAAALGAGMAGVCAFPTRSDASSAGPERLPGHTGPCLEAARTGEWRPIAILQPPVVEERPGLAGQLERALESRGS